MKIIAGLMRAHKDCHDTKYELLELWVNEIYRTYFEKLSKPEKPEVFERVSGVMMYYFGEEAKSLLGRLELKFLFDGKNKAALSFLRQYEVKSKL
jgi:hypothetical protein